MKIKKHTNKITGVNNSRLCIYVPYNGLVAKEKGKPTLATQTAGHKSQSSAF
jgi:hypothetical protein